MNKQTNNNSAYLILLATLSIFYVITYLLQSDINHFTAAYVETLHSEYTTAEQLTKFYLLVIMLASLMGAYWDKSPARLKITTAFMLLALTLYLAESNMIKEKLQPLFAAIILLPMLYWLIRNRSLPVIISFFAAWGFISMGVLKDFYGESMTVKNLLPDLIVSLIMLLHEETWDCFGIGILALSALLWNRAALTQEAKLNLPGTLLLFFCMLLIAIGNGFAHAQYHPSRELWIAASVITLAGLILFYGIQRFWLSGSAQILSENPVKFYSSVIFLFLFVPLFVAKHNYFTSLILWGLATYVTIRLYRLKLEQQKHIHASERNAEAVSVSAAV